MSNTPLLPPPDYWKRRDNSILLDVETLEFRVHNRTRNRIRIFLGRFDGPEFSITIPTIQVLTDEEQNKIRDKVRYIILDFIKSFKTNAD
jgi:hypothetical protein